jgi:hypothetical protein
MKKFIEKKEQALAFYKEYEHYSPALFFGIGFLFDLLTLGYVDDLFGLVSQSFYFFICILVFHLEVLKKELPKIEHYKNEIFHFCSGALLSAYTIFFFKSSSIANSFFFLIFVTALLFINEFDFFKKQALMAKSLLISLTGFFLFISIYPLIFKTISPIVFYLSLVSMSLLYFALFKFYKKKALDDRFLLKSLIYPHAGVQFLLLFSFVLKIIPPIPLVLNYTGIFHHVEKKNGEYLLYHEKPWWRFWHEGDEKFYARSQDKVYVFSEVYSPAKIDTTILAKFELKTSRGWQVSDKIPLPITGGRQEGYRGYAFKRNYSEGDWRVIISTQDEREIGRHYFEILKSEEPATDLNLFKVKIR